MKQTKKSFWVLSFYETILRSNNLILWVQVQNEAQVTDLRHKLIPYGLVSIMVNIKILSLLKIFKVYSNTHGGCSLFIYSKDLSLEKLEYLVKLEREDNLLILWWSLNQIKFIEGALALEYYLKSLKYLNLNSRASSLGLIYYEMLSKYISLLNVPLKGMTRIGKYAGKVKVEKN